MGTISQGEPEKESDSEPRSLTAIFRPDAGGEWREKLRASHEASEQARLLRETPMGNGNPWGGRGGDEDDVKDEEPDVDDDESSVVGDGEGGKLWKAKRTLRK
jgi:striatin 1/3/4